MAEFTSEINPSKSRVVLYITIAVAVSGLLTVWGVMQYQKSHPAPKAASGPIVVPGMKHSGDPEFEAYKSSVRLENVKGTIGIPIAGPRFALVDGILSNEGARSLEAVEMHITLFDVYGKLSKEVTRTPLRPGIGMENRPMAPLEKRGFHFGVEAVEQLWDPKKVVIEISGLKYK
jgi:hypothetical protein